MPAQQQAAGVVCHVMRLLLILMCISFVYFSCKQSGTKHIIDITPENNDSREERHLREAMLDRTRKLNLPILQVDSDKLEIRIWVSDFLKGESVLDIKIEGKVLP
jgi:hypothetical protein